MLGLFTFLLFKTNDVLEQKGYLDTPPASFLIEGRKMSGRITSLEEDLKPLLLCQSMGLKIVSMYDEIYIIR